MSEQTVAGQRYETLIARLMRFEPRNGYRQASDVELDQEEIETVAIAYPDVLKGVRPCPKRLNLAMAAQGLTRDRLLLSAVENAIELAAREFVFNDLQERLALPFTCGTRERAYADSVSVAYGVPL